MFNDFIQMKADEDGCLYLFHKDTGAAKKVCDIGNNCELPLSIIKQIRMFKEAAAVLPDV